MTISIILIKRIGETLVENVMNLYKQCKIADMLLVDVLKGMKMKYEESTPNVEPMPKDDDVKINLSIFEKSTNFRMTM